MIRTIKEHDLYLTYTWNANKQHGICGHTFEVIDYYLILKNKFKVGIILAEINEQELRNIIISKYNLTDEELDNLIENTLFISRNTKLLNTTNILFTDGSIGNLDNITVIAKNIFLFSCGNREIIYNTNPKYIILQDYRIYGENTFNSFNYKKKILFNKLKHITNYKQKYMIYATSNCRLISEEEIYRIKEKYNIDDLLIISNYPYQLKDVTVINPPVENIFEQFSTYIYTEVPRHFDCSPRFLGECKFYNKEIILEIDYLEEDLGLYYRWRDIQEDFESINLTEEDDIIGILNEYI